MLTTDKINYFEIGSPDPAASRAFYAGLFEWEIDESPQGDQPYRMVDGSNGGLWDTSTMGREDWAIFYVHVDDVTAALERAVALGASVAILLVDNGQIYFAHLLDLQGNRFGIWQPKE